MNLRSWFPRSFALGKASRSASGSVESFYRQAARVASVVIHKGFWRELPVRRAPLFVAGALKHGFRTRTIHELHARAHPDRLALADEHRSLTYAQANLEMNQLANALRVGLDVRAGAPVILMMENRVEYVVAWFALARLSCSAVHCSYRATPAELSHLVTHSGARLLLCSDATLAVAQQVAAQQPQLSLLVLGDAPLHGPREHRYQDVLAGGALHFPDPPPAGVHSENIVYTSGTTGKPKGAVRDFAAFGVVELARLLERLPFFAGERHLVVSPMYHSGGQVFVILLSALGATIHLRPHFEALDTLTALSRLDIQSVFLVPTMLRRLLNLPASAFASHPTPRLRGLVCGAAEFPHALRLQAIERFGAAAVHDFYGATELGWVTHLDGLEMLRKPGSVGKPMPGQQLEIQGPQGHALPPDAVGTICVRNAQTMAGYLHDQAATQDSVRAGWMTVEDLGRVDGDGYLFLAGRERDMVKSGGVNIYPMEIEEVLNRHPGVLECAVIGIPDVEWGETLLAVLVPRTPGGLVTADVERFARGELSSIKVPKRWQLVEELPRNPTGKVLKKDLRARYAPPLA